MDGPTVGYRIADMHGHSDLARKLYLNPEVMRLIELIYGEPAVAFQSLYFTYGSQQALHRDPMFVPTDPPSHLLASWTALEDTSSDGGPLLYVPGSHRMPWHETSPGNIRLGRTVDKDARAAWREYRKQQMKEMGLKVQEFVCERGDVFIWHAGLLHGGKKLVDPERTRRSFVVHYCTARNYTSRSTSVKFIERDGDEPQYIGMVAETSDRLREGGYEGVQAPLYGLDRDRALALAHEQRRERHRARGVLGQVGAALKKR
ncbi:MAG: phytanoyl-CoA dioxygenase family protein [Acidimicrobiia bacterium]|nr:phytanoyl-CoA dioxygenase family protein [Acidimicrobiia bacterium]